jgi:hypothetical protein
MAFCSECGAAVVKSCEHCKGSMERDPIYDKRPPLYCSSCGKAFPWTEAALKAAKEYADELDELNGKQKAELKATFDDLSVDTPRTELATHRFKKFLQKVGPATGAALMKIVVNIATEAAKKELLRCIRAYCVSDTREPGSQGLRPSCFSVWKADEGAYARKP